MGIVQWRYAYTMKRTRYLKSSVRAIDILNAIHHTRKQKQQVKNSG